MKILVIIGAAVQAVVGLFLLLLAPYLAATKAEVGGVAASQAIGLVVAILAIVFVITERWRALSWLGALGLGYWLANMGYRIGQGHEVSVVLTDTIFAAWYAACMLLGRKQGRVRVVARR